MTRTPSSSSIRRRRRYIFGNLLCSTETCAKSDSLLVLCTQKERTSTSMTDYYGEDKENINDNKMRRNPAPPAAGCAGCAPAPHARCSPPRPVALVAAAAANVDQLVDNLAQVDLGTLVFNFQARYPHVFVSTPSLTLASGQATVVGYWLIPSVDQTRFSVEVSPTGMHSVFNMDIPRQFASLNACVFLEVVQVFIKMHLQSQLASAKCRIRFYVHLLTLQSSAQLDRLTLSLSLVIRTQHLFKFCSREMIFFSIG